MILALTTDNLTIRRLSTVAREIGVDFTQIESLESAGHQVVPLALIVSLERPGALDLVPAAKEQWPLAMIVGVLKLPSADLWRQAEDAGCDLVTTVGAIQRGLAEKLERWSASPRGRRLRLFEMADIAGRLGVVARIDDAATGPVAIYHLGGDIVAVQDLCPHAGAILSRGDVGIDDGVITCPEHGSRFDSRSGERLRGPADVGLVTYPVVVEDGQAYLQLERI